MSFLEFVSIRHHVFWPVFGMLAIGWYFGSSLTAFYVRRAGYPTLPSRIITLLLGLALLAVAYAYPGLMIIAFSLSAALLLLAHLIWLDRAGRRHVPALKPPFSAIAGVGMMLLVLSFVGHILKAG